MSTRSLFPFRCHCCVLLSVMTSGLVIHAAVSNAFEQDHRINNLTMQFGTDSFATNNRFGGAFSGGLVRNQVQGGIDAAIEDGSISILFTFPGLLDLTGTNEPSLLLGVVNGEPVLLPGNPTSYSGASDLDWWYTLNSDEVNAAGAALQQMPGSITNRVLNAGPGQLTFGNSPLGGGAPLSMWSVFVKASIGASSTPLRSTNNFPPGHRAGENLDPALVSFSTMAQGQLKGNVSSASLAGTPIPAALAGGGLFTCSQNYNATNTFLDLVVGGCTAFIIGTQITATQPDKFDPNAPVVGAGPPYVFTRTGTRVTGARDRLSNPVDLQSALNASAYSAYFSFTTDRVIAFTAPNSAPRITGMSMLDNGAFHFAFTNAPRASFTILSATNVELPRTNWSVLGAPTQTMSGVFEFADPGATNRPRRFYRVRSP